MASLIVRMVHDLVRDAIADVIGKVASKVAIGVLTAGLAAPWAVTSVVADVSSWVTRLAKEVTDAVLSARNLKELLDKATHLLDDVGAAFARIPAKASQAASRRVEALEDLASHLGPQHALAGAPGMTTAQAHRTGKAGKAKPTVKSPSTTSKTRPSRPNHNDGRWGARLDDAGAGAKGARGADDTAEAAAGGAKGTDAADAAVREKAEAHSSATTGETGSQWDDPGKVQEWHDEPPTRTHPSSTEAYRYQHRVLGTNVERQLPTGDGKGIWADSVTVEGDGVAMAWDAKHTGGGDSALYEGSRPPFSREKL